MKPITKIIIGLVGVAAIGLLTYYVVTKEKKIKGVIVKANVIQDTIFDRIKKELSIDGEEFTLTEDEGVYTNSTNDKMLVIKEDIWKKIIRKTQKTFPSIAKDCNQKDEMPNLSEYKFVGLLTYLAYSKNSTTTSAYSAIEIRNGNLKSFAGGEICCDCEGEPLVAQKVDAVIIK
jgi:hypothetical protein